MKCLKSFMLVVLIALAVSSMFQGFRNGLRIIDFHWESAALMLKGDNPYQYAMDDRTYCELGVDATQAPSTIALILPYGAFSKNIGNLLWDVSNLVFVVVFFSFLIRTWFSERRGVGWLLFCVFVAGTPWRVCIGNGQHAMFSFMFFMMAYWAIENRKPWWLVGLLLTFGAFKYTVMAPIYLIFLAKKEWKSFTAFIVLHIILTAVMAWWCGVSPFLMIQQNLRISSWYAGQGVADFASLASAYGVKNIFPYASIGYVIWGLLAVGIAFSKAFDDLLKIALLALCANLICYHRIYDFVTLVFLLAYITRDFSRLSLAVRSLSLVLVGFVFFGEKVLHCFHISGFMEVTFLLHVLTLVVFLYEGYSQRDSSQKVKKHFLCAMK